MGQNPNPTVQPADLETVEPVVAVAAEPEAVAAEPETVAAVAAVAAVPEAN